MPFIDCYQRRMIRVVCDSCLKQFRISREAKKFLEVLLEPMSKSEAQHRAGLTITIVNGVIRELEATALIDYEESGRSKIYRLTDNGRRYLDIEKGPGKEPIIWKSF